MITIKQRPSYSTAATKVLATGRTLKEACINWENNRFCNDDLYDAFKNSKYYSEELQEAEEIEQVWVDQYYIFLDSLSGEEMFNIMCDGTYTTYEGEDDYD